MCKVLDDCILERFETNLAHNNKRNNLFLCTMTPHAQARVWQFAAATATTTAKYMLFCLLELCLQTTNWGTKTARSIRSIPT